MLFQNIILKELNYNFNKYDVIKILSEIGNVFTKYDVNKNFGLILLHKHFKQSDNEYLVEIISNDKTVTSIWKNNKPKNKDVLKKYNIEYVLEDNNYIQPHSWLLKKIINYYHMNFMLKVKKSKTPVNIPKKEFVFELYNTLKKYNLNDILGLHFLHRPFKNLVEDTDEEYHANVLIIEPEEYDKSKYIEVIWTFGNDGKNRCHCRCYGDDPHNHGCS